MNSIDDSPRASSCSLSTEIFVLELDHLSFDGKDMTKGLEGIIALSSSELFLGGG